MRNLKDIILERLRVTKNNNVLYPAHYYEIDEIIDKLCDSVVIDDDLYNEYCNDGYKFIEDYLDMSAFKKYEHNTVAEITSALANIIENRLFKSRIYYICSAEDYVLKVVDNQYTLYYMGQECRKAPVSFKYFLPGYNYQNNLKYGYDSTDLVTYGVGSDLPWFIFAKTEERLLQLISDLDEDPYYIDYGGDFDERDIVYIGDYDNRHPYFYSENRYTDTKERLDDNHNTLEEYIKRYDELIDEL